MRPGLFLRCGELVLAGLLFVLVAAPCLAAGSLAADLTPEEQAWIAQHPTIRVANELDWQPFDFAENGEPQGYSIDLMRLAAKKVGLSVDFINGHSWNTLLQMGRQREIDVFPAIWTSPERATFLSFTKAYIDTPLTLLVKSGDKSIHRIEDLSGKTLAGVEGYASVDLVKEHYPDITVVEVATPAEGLRLVAYGKVDAYLGSLASASYEIRSRLILGVAFAGETDLGGRFREQQLHMAVRQDWPALRAILDKALDAITAEERLELQRKWIALPAHAEDDLVPLTPQEKAFVDNTVVKAATTTNWLPFAFVDETGQPDGIGYEYWQEIVQQAGLITQITPFTVFADELASVRDKTQDLIYSVGITKEREAYSLFSKPYASFPLVIATSKDENYIPDVNQLRGRKIAVGNKFTAQKMMAESYPDLDYLLVKNVQEGLQAVSRGNAYAFVDILPVVSHSINQYGFTNLKISGETGLAFDLRLMIRKDYPELVSIANKAIDRIPLYRKQAIIDRWINVQYQTGYDYSRYFPYVFAGLALTALVFVWLILSRQHAHRANRAKSEFLALMSHDLRTPLNAIMGFSDIIRSQMFGPLGNPKYEEYASDIHRSGTLLVNLINDILDLSKVEAGKYTLVEEDIDVPKLIDGCINQCSILATPKMIQLSVRLDGTLPLLRADERVLTQILNNLLSNAIKYSQNGAKVTLTAFVEHRGGFELIVADTGVGMTPEDVKRVTRPFEQANRQRARTQEGTGLGLYLCQSLMTLLGGELKIESAPGLGTSVTLSFPSKRTIKS